MPNVPRHLFPPVVVQLLPETVPLVSSHLSSTPTGPAPGATPKYVAETHRPEVAS
jgi:hypothetical protein